MNDIIIPRNLVHGKQAKVLIRQNKALPLSKDMAFLNFEIQPKYKNIKNSQILYSVENQKSWINIYSDKKTSIKIHLATDFIYALTKNRRAYSFSEMEEYNKDIRKEILFGLRFGVIIPINRNNPEKFYYR